MKKKKKEKKIGKFFQNKFKECSKYNFLINNLGKYNKIIDQYKIPYTFFNEFIYYTNGTEKNFLSQVNVFELIDQFYGKSKFIDFDEIEFNDYKRNMENYFNFSYDKFAEFYKEELRSMINREQEDDKAIFKKLKVNKKYKAYQRKGSKNIRLLY